MRDDYMDLLSYGGHMYWMKPSEETKRSNWEKWDARLSKHIRFFSSLHWENLLSKYPEAERTLYSPHANIATCVVNLPRHLVIFTKFPEADLISLRLLSRNFEWAGDCRWRRQMGIHELNWAFGDMYSARPAQANPAAPPIHQLPLALPITSPFLEPTNPEWPTGNPHG